MDPTGFVIDGRSVLYFLDMVTLSQPASDPRVIYRATSLDGVNFDRPHAAYAQTSNVDDPFVLRLPDGSFRMYAPSDDVDGIISACGSDGLVFTREDGTRLICSGGLPGALLLPDHRVHLFLASDGIASYISDVG